VLALYFAHDRAAAFDTCYALLRFGGLGHTAVVHSRDDAVIREFGVRMPAGRIVVNSPAPQGSIGSSTNLFPAMTLGCGAVGGNITSDNISPLHLINLRRIAYEARPLTTSAVVEVSGTPAPATTAAEACACKSPGPAEVLVPDLGTAERVAVARAIERFLTHKGAGPVTTTSTPPQPVASPPMSQESSLPPVRKLKPRPVDFVSEAEIRAAIQRKEKILIGPKTIVTPAARDLAAQHDVFTVAE
jgi:acetaldehyde dehydrogenase (acetylating)